MTQGKKHVWENHILTNKDLKIEGDLTKQENDEIVLSYLHDDGLSIREHLYCKWPDCKFYQYDKDRWKAKRHIFDKHLKETLSENLRKGKPVTNYGNLTKEEQKKINEDVEKYIGICLAKQKKRKRNEKVEKVEKVPTEEEEVVPVQEEVKIEIPKVEIPDYFTPRVGTMIWDSSKIKESDLEVFIHNVQKTVDFKISHEKVYQVIHENNYDLSLSKNVIKNDVSVLEKNQLERKLEYNLSKNASSERKNTTVSSPVFHLVCDYIQIKRKKLL